MSKAEVLVVHCVDTEGPIGGDVRRRPDGSREFMETWGEIEASIGCMTSGKNRKQLEDSYGSPYLFNWFIMDFTGFKTNPKQRVAVYNDTYDHFKSMETAIDGFYWHYHHPPANGVGDQWSQEWNSSNEYLNILLHRLMERGDFPEVYRAGGTIEDNSASLWLEDNVMVDYSNRVSRQSTLTNNINDFNWHGAPSHWGYYHPHKDDFLRPGDLRRYIVRSVDLWSRLHVLTVKEVREAFHLAQQSDSQVILSFFSHDHREMRDETAYGAYLIKQVSKETGVPWRSSRALQAIQESAKIVPVHIEVSHKMDENQLNLRFSDPSYQPRPFVAARLESGEICWLESHLKDSASATVSIPKRAIELVVGGTSQSGDKFIKKIDLCQGK